jgi:hypothetical protein
MVLNLKDAKDVNSAASALLLESTDKKILGRLDTGQAVVKLQGRWHRPFTINIPLVKIRKGSVSDVILREKMRPYSTYFMTEHDELIAEAGIPEYQDPRKTILEISDEENCEMFPSCSWNNTGICTLYEGKEIALCDSEPFTTQELCESQGCTWNTGETDCSDDSGIIYIVMMMFLVGFMGFYVTEHTKDKWIKDGVAKVMIGCEVLLIIVVMFGSLGCLL